MNDQYLGKPFFDIIQNCPADGCGFSQLNAIISAAITLLLQVSIPIAGAVILYGGIRMLISSGSPDNIKAGKDAIFGALIGLGIVFGAFIIYNIVIKAIFFTGSL